MEASLSEEYILIRKKKSIPVHQMRSSEFCRTDIAINQFSYSLILDTEMDIDPEHELIIRAEPSMLRWS